MEPWSIVVVRSFGAVIWGIVLIRAILHRDDDFLANRPRRIALYAAAFAYAAAVVTGGLAGSLQVVPSSVASLIYTVVSAVTGTIGFSILVTPDHPVTRNRRKDDPSD